MDTIFALASAPGKAGVAVLRVSGPDAWTSVERLAGKVPPARTTSLRTLKDEAGIFLDQAMIVVFEEGASFTGERIAEFHLHGSISVVNAVLSFLSKLPSYRMAQPGEFTRRALDNGQLDLTQVEALSDLIDAETEAQRKQAIQVLTGALSDKVIEWRAKLVRAAALLEATIDFVDEDVPYDVSDEVVSLLSSVKADLETEHSGVDAAERIRSGFEVAIVGPPNAGKSTLLNYLAGREAAITSDVAGTTRDVIEVRMDILGLAVTFLDTAGLRETSDVVEQIGVKRAKDRASAADLRIHLARNEEELLLPVQKEDIVLVPKQDHGHPKGVSGHSGFGVSVLLDNVKSVLSGRVANAGLASRARHRENLGLSISYIDRALTELLDENFQADLVSEDIRVAIRYLETLVGKINVEDLLDEIFSSFCIGK
ncbi:tRNA uridine-5-carboxymethylaminomethyl(34) synthesis GTPase MnmE [Sagittula sp. NFXS13]|uniref:tRNA uridine-5-carboxymethylaminomethyl(34) synthesis GTPase MnmE n=1 Tax=Sagittula sp. NFXS13 TaxID=2819095 RepID=UPI0032DF366E